MLSEGLSRHVALGSAATTVAGKPDRTPRLRYPSVLPHSAIGLPNRGPEGDLTRSGIDCEVAVEAAGMGEFRHAFPRRKHDLALTLFLHLDGFVRSEFQDRRMLQLEDLAGFAVGTAQQPLLTNTACDAGTVAPNVCAVTLATRGDLRTYLVPVGAVRSDSGPTRLDGHAPDRAAYP